MSIQFRTRTLSPCFKLTRPPNSLHGIPYQLSKFTNRPLRACRPAQRRFCRGQGLICPWILWTGNRRILGTRPPSLSRSQECLIGTLQNLSSHVPNFYLIGKSYRRLCRKYPSQCPHCKSTKQNQRDPGTVPFGLGFEAGCTDVAAGFVEPP